MTESLYDIARRALMSDKCECGGAKEKGQSFCRACYFALPMTKRSELYRSFSDGYASIWDDARTYLRAETERFAKKPEPQGGLFQ